MVDRDAHRGCRVGGTGGANYLAVLRRSGSDCRKLSTARAHSGQAEVPASQKSRVQKNRHVTANLPHAAVQTAHLSGVPVAVGNRAEYGRRPAMRCCVRLLRDGSAKFAAAVRAMDIWKKPQSTSPPSIDPLQTSVADAVRHVLQRILTTVEAERETSPRLNASPHVRSATCEPRGSWPPWADEEWRRFIVIPIIRVVRVVIHVIRPRMCGVPSGVSAP